MKFVSVIVDKKLPVKRSHIIQEMGRVCANLEGTDKEVVVMNEDML